MPLLRWSRLQNPSPRWRRVAAGVALAIPGVVAGCILDLVSRNLRWPLIAVIGAAGGFGLGFWLEGRK